MKKYIITFILTIELLCPKYLVAIKLRDLAHFADTSEETLVGYGIVAGLSGTGDSIKKSFIANRHFNEILTKVGIKALDEQNYSKNIAAVIITAKVPYFATSGSKVDITISAAGDATSINSGFLIPTKLFNINNTSSTYAIAQGKVKIVNTQNNNYWLSGSVNNGAIIKVRDNKFNNKNLKLILNKPDINKIHIIHKKMEGVLEKSGKIDIISPSSIAIQLRDGLKMNKKIELLAMLNDLDIPNISNNKVVINSETGTIIIGGDVTLSEVAITKKNINIDIKNIGKKNKLAEDNSIMEILKESTKLKELIANLNKIGAQPKELIEIIHALKAAGALKAEVEVIS